MGLKISTMAPIVPLAKKERVETNEVKWLSQKEVAKYLGVSNAWVSVHTNQPIDPIPHRRLSGMLQYDPKKVEEWERRNSEYKGMEA